ncbi:diphosphomevalonate decarboxylase [Marinilactibacillus psychrotolerans]|uniref:diphosphomevalonate decarboxylase n=2 Tax=Marinilactibacillus psychrotolerans TaxID=191770 RepID=A0A5R9C8F2_9LACT|nr:diphosphomevalonate decarboxylase [Marinilactibacillus psychrotolerans]TLQ09617.1 diphosphomevalonate decarboxylase [Marinilactibacillus psychrotolerans]GEQ32887.1 diphosphomevalonate decarboxylase [Marinilactibacillus psychrotolerans]SJN31222.1 Diphosphomevalonate decarboxylase [Marinilactibacillus psychrotolerans 42ea]
MSKWVRAHTNIALIKYWGKEDEEFIIPKNNSLSLTLDAFYTDTRVTFDSSLKEDQLILDGEEQDASALKKVSTILDIVRNKAELTDYALVESINYVPTAAGLASSASGLAALAGAANEASELNLSAQELSRLARRGSGSASRSIYGGFVEWEKGINDETSFAHPIDNANWDIGMLFIIVKQAKKEVSSRDGMQRTVTTSPFYAGWLSTLDQDLTDMKLSIAEQNIDKVGAIAERNALKMHATTLGAQPPFTYWTADSMIAMDAVRKLRKENYSVYFTMDAGPNVKVICKQSEMDKIKKALLAYFDEEQIISAKPGPGIQVLENR